MELITIIILAGIIAGCWYFLKKHGRKKLGETVEKVHQNKQLTAAETRAALGKSGAEIELELLKVYAEALNDLKEESVNQFNALAANFLKVTSIKYDNKKQTVVLDVEEGWTVTVLREEGSAPLFQALQQGPLSLTTGIWGPRGIVFSFKTSHHQSISVKGALAEVNKNT